MNFTRRRASIATFITLGVLLTGTAIFLNIGWIILNKARVAYLVLGVVFFAILIAGLVLNTIFLVREVRRNERQDSFLNAVTHELKTPIASIRLYLDTLQRRPLDDAQRQKFYAIMHADSDRLIATVESVLKAGELGQRARHHDRTVIDLAPLVADCIVITLSRHHLPPESITLAPVPGQVRLRVLGLPDDLRTAILNLLENAVKYSPPTLDEPTPRITCTLAITGYRFVALAIADRGLGIPPRRAQAHLPPFLPHSRQLRDQDQGHRPRPLPRPHHSPPARRHHSRRQPRPPRRRHPNPKTPPRRHLTLVCQSQRESAVVLLFAPQIRVPHVSLLRHGMGLAQPHALSLRNSAAPPLVCHSRNESASALLFVITQEPASAVAVALT